MTTVFYVLVVLPSVAFVFLVLSTFFGTRRAYFAICWIPVTLFLFFYVFQRLLAFDPSQAYRAKDLLTVTSWVSLVQCGLGVALAVRAFYQRRHFIGLLLAAGLTGLPYFLLH